jgi:hypothetical protein
LERRVPFALKTMAMTHNKEEIFEIKAVSPISRHRHFIPLLRGNENESFRENP